MALVGKASGIGRLGERHAIQDQLADTLQSAHGQEPVRARSVGGAELPRERPAVEPARRFELAIADPVRKMLKQHLARPAQPRSLKREVAPNRRPRVARSINVAFAIVLVLSAALAAFH